ncbi:hypothetical protein COCOBI_13-2210 [Coccomyxa sp. Obi]|nr:hypothetical protein COCOBI_13-2210 [Coccomyxa sp. Obi]
MISIPDGCGDTGAGLPDPMLQQFKAQYIYNQKMLEGLEVALGTANLSKNDIEVDECEKTLEEDTAKGYEMTAEELIADIMSLDKEIQADLDYSTKMLEIMKDVAPELVAGQHSID